MNYYGICGKDQLHQFPVAPGVPNLTLRASWGYLEPAMGQFNWDRIDAGLAALPEGGRAALWIHSGNETPAWVLNQVAHFVMEDGSMFPAPWDARFLALLKGLIKACGEKYRDEARLVRVMIPALCARTAETNLNNIYVVGGAQAHPDEAGSLADILAYWQSVGYTPHAAVYAAQQGIMAMRKYVRQPAAITWLSAHNGLNFDPVGGGPAIQSIHEWFSQQPNVVIYNLAASNHGVLPKLPNLAVPYAYQEVGPLYAQRAFDQMVGLVHGQAVEHLEVYLPDLPFVPHAPPVATSDMLLTAEAVRNHQWEHYRGEFTASSGVEAPARQS